MLPGIRVRSHRCRDGGGPGHLPGGLRRAARPGAWRLPRGVLRLRDPAPELRHRPVGQDPITEREVPQAHAHPDRAAVRHRPHAGGSGGHVDGAAAARRRGAVHRRSQRRSPSRRTSSPDSTSASDGPDPWSLQGIRQPRVAEIVASRLRDEILSGRLKEGDVLPSQESLFQQFGVSPPALREAIHILETDGSDLRAARQRRGSGGAPAVGSAHRAHDQHGAADPRLHTRGCQRGAAAPRTDLRGDVCGAGGSD